MFNEPRFHFRNALFEVFDYREGFAEQFGVIEIFPEGDYCEVIARGEFRELDF